MFAYVEDLMKAVQPVFASPSASAGQKTVDRTIHSPSEMTKSTQSQKRLKVRVIGNASYSQSDDNGLTRGSFHSEDEPPPRRGGYVNKQPGRPPGNV
ncbi:hypothetical protein E4U59_000845 [Claviceps monticola]|nr:hypothetical protein E4U59_000845 [Claviceps monticola]